MHTGRKRKKKAKKAKTATFSSPSSPDFFLIDFPLFNPPEEVDSVAKEEEEY